MDRTVGTDARRAGWVWPTTGWSLFVVISIAYVAGSELAFRLADEAGMQAVLFVPAGVTAGALLRVDRSQWWIVLVAAAGAELVQDLRADLGLSSIGFVAANVVEPLVGALAVSAAVRAPIDLSFRRHIGAFLGFSVALGPMIGGAIGGVTDAAGGDEFLRTFLEWWLGDAVGVLLVGGLVLVWRSSPDQRPVHSPWGVVLVAASMAGTVAVLALSDLPLLFVVLTGVVVAGAQFGTRAVAVTSVAVAVTIAVWLVFEQGGVFAGMSDATALVLAKLKLVVFTSAGLVVAAEVVERERLSAAASRLQAEAAAEHAVVERLQQLLLPPEFMRGDHFDGYGSYLAGTSRLGVGGDWYDVSALPDGRVLVTVGDVVGRGAAAAAVMGRLRAVVSVLAVDAPDAGALLASVDSRIDGVLNALGTTLWVGLYEPRRARLSYASAGHPPGFVLTTTGVFRLDGALSPPLGLAPHATKQSRDVELGHGCTLVLYTDGLIERRREILDVGLAELQRLLDGMHHETPERLVHALEPNRHDDDTVILAVRLGCVN